MAMSTSKIALITVGSTLGGLLLIGGCAASMSSDSASTSPSAGSATEQANDPAPAPASTVDQGYGSKDASGDVTLGEGVYNGYSWTVPVTVTNGSEKRSNYDIDAAAETPDGLTQLDTGWTYLSNVEPGQTATDELMFFEEFPEGTVFVVKEVSRTSAVG